MRLLITLSFLALLTACGNNKSATTATGGNITPLGSAPLALCNKSSDSNFSISTSVVKDQMGAISADWLKLKFNFLNQTMAASGNVIKFFKWKVVNGASVLDTTPLMVSTYDFASGQTTSQPASGLPADQITGNTGFYIQLNDPAQVYQVLKIVAYDSKGTPVGNLNSLIPSFYANPTNYTLNADGTPRAIGLQQLHPLYGATNADPLAYFNQFCF
jgi:hypothetical protein